jgi:hypothetical protein
MASDRWPTSPVAIGLIVAVNAVPLAGVLLPGWSLPLILLLYRIETGVVGVVTVFLIALASGPMGAEAPALRSAIGPGSARGCLGSSSRACSTSRSTCVSTPPHAAVPPPPAQAESGADAASRQCRWRNADRLLAQHPWGEYLPGAATYGLSR